MAEEEDAEWLSLLRGDGCAASSRGGRGAAGQSLTSRPPVALEEAAASRSLLAGEEDADEEDTVMAWRKLLEEDWKKAVSTANHPEPVADAGGEEPSKELQQEEEGPDHNVFIELDEGFEEEEEEQEEEEKIAEETSCQGTVWEVSESEDEVIADAGTPNGVAAEKGKAIQPKALLKAMPKFSQKPSWRRQSHPAESCKEQEYITCNPGGLLDAQGLAYKLCKDGADEGARGFAEWNSKVRGTDDGDGWLRVKIDFEEKFLPFIFDGYPVLLPISGRADRSQLTVQPRSAAVTKALTTAIGPRPSCPPGDFKLAAWKNYPGSKAPTSVIPARKVVPSRSPLAPSSAPTASLGKSSATAKRPGPLNLGGQPAKRSRSFPVGDGKPVKHAFGPGAKPGPGQVVVREFDLCHVVVNFINVGSTFGEKVLGRSKALGNWLFDWEGVRRCVKHLHLDMGLQVIGVIYENYRASDNDRRDVPIPADIREMCESIEETPRLTGKNQRSADDEMTIKCAWRRNCRYMDNDNYRDWKKDMANNECRSWLEMHQELLHMRYFFDSKLGSFDTLDGNVRTLASGPRSKQ